jgi:putative tricarboxylic transport membrane protein
MDLGRLNHPGPGFLPLGTAVLLVFLCTLYALRSVWTHDEAYIRKESPWPRNWGKIVGVLVALFLFTFLLDTLGFMTATFLLMVFLFRLGGPESWVLTTAKGALSVLVTYAVFGRWLMVQFPKGFLGF